MVFASGGIGRSAPRRIEGDVETGSVMAGQSVGMVTSEQPVSEILAELIEQAEKALGNR